MSEKKRIEKDRTRDLGEVRTLTGFAFLRYLWRLLTSMRTALTLLLLLGLASIPGSIIPQRAQNPFQVQDFFEANPTIAPIFDRLYLFDVFGAPWFSAIYVLLFISLIGCVIPRLNEYRKAIFERPTEAPATLENFTGYRRFQGDIEEVAALLKLKRFRMEKFGAGYTFEKGYFKESGNLLFHFSLILILIGIAASSLFGMRGEAIVNVGERFINTPVTYDNLTPGRFYSVESLQPYRIELQEFYAEYDPVTNAAREYELKVRVREDLDSPFTNEVMRVNQPLTFGASRVFLQATGYSVLVTVRNSMGSITYQGPVPLLPIDPTLTSTGEINVPDMEPSVVLVASFLPTAARDEIRGGFSSYPE
ncbi:MAG: cytochrome c biogenesis protein ResB, partial [Actinomycetota bacterium]